MKKYNNPFQIGLPIQSPDNFIGRKEFISILYDAMSNLQNISIHAEQRTGKTSLLLYLAHPESDIGLNTNHIPVYFDFQRVTNATQNDVWLAIANKIAEEIIKRDPDKKEMSEKFFTTIEKAIQSQESSELVTTYFGQALNDLHDSGLFIHLLLDEFDQTALNNTNLGNNFYDSLHILPTQTENLSYIIATRGSLAEFQLSDKKYDSPFFNIFNKSFSLTPFSKEDVYSLIFNYFASAGLDKTLTDKLCGEIPFLYDVSGYHPFFLQMICYYLCSDLGKANWISKESKRTALKAFEKKSIQYFEFYWKHSSEKEREMIRLLASDSSNINWNKEEHLELINKLKDRSLVISTDNDNVKLFSSVFKKWVYKKDHPDKITRDVSKNEGSAEQVMMNKIQSDNLHNDESDSSLLIQDYQNEIKHIGKEYYEIKITQDTTLFVDRKNGKILGPQGEGTLAIVFYAGVSESKNSKTLRLATERAIRIPRLLQSDSLLNYHIAEISFYEGKQAHRYTGDHYLLSAIFFHNLTHEIPIRMPNDLIRRPCYIGFYLSPNSEYKICLLSEESAFPDIFEKYVDEKYGGTSKLFQSIKASLKNFSSNKMDKIIFIPFHEGEETYKNCDDKKGNQPILVGRENLSQLYSDKEANGWWFNLPVAGYPWMSADLQRLLTGYLDDEDKNHFKGLENWKIDSWAEMIQNLAQGLYYLHQKGGVHGDIRPANIMTNVYEERELLPDQFKWIDVGLASDEFTEFSDDLQTSITPRPLGDERKTPFYAQERNEVLEFEDADKISIRQDKEKGILLSFLWRQRTTDDVVFPLKIRDKGLAIRELGKLKEGDRIQVREFLFDINEVNETDILIKNVYEVGFGRLMIQKTGEELERLIKRLDGASISRYRIYKQWSQATDIYGFGVLVLYLFYMRGLYNFRQTCKNTEDQESQSNINELAFNRLRRERTFEEFISLLKNQSFLEIFLHHLISVTGLKTTEEIWNLENEKEIGEKLSELAEVIIGLDPTSALILDGVGSYRLFIQIVYFALCCLWREDEADEVMLSATRLEYHELIPFCKDRFKIRENQPEASAKALKDAIDQIIRQNYKNEFIELTKRDRGEIGATWQKRITNLRERVDDLEKTVRTLEKEKKDLKGQIDNLSFEKKGLSIKISTLENDNKTLKRKLENLDTENRLLQTEIGNLNNENNKLKKSFNLFSKENKNLKTRLEILNKEYTDIKANFDTLEKEHADINAGFDTLKKQDIAFKIKLNTELVELSEEIKSKLYSLQKASDNFSSTFYGAYKKAEVDQFLSEIFFFLENICDSISRN